MHDFLMSYGLFLARTVTWVLAIGTLVVLITNSVRGARQSGGERLEIKDLNGRYQQMADTLRSQVLAPHAFRQEMKQRKAESKARSKLRKKEAAARPRLFVLDFHGDLEASRCAALREEISTLVQVARPQDEVLLRLESAGGVVHGYGLAASQLARLRQRGIRLTAAIDKVAASGGYMMACVAQHIIASPFAIIGSIGVVGQLPNFNRLLRENHIDYELHTAGEFKRTLTVFGENSDAARAKFQEQLEHTHTLFKNFVAANRPQLELSQVATGEHWYGSQALALKLVDEIKTGDDYLLDRAQTHDVFELRYRLRRNLREQLVGNLGRAARLWRGPAGML